MGVTADRLPFPSTGFVAIISAQLERIVCPPPDVGSPAFRGNDQDLSVDIFKDLEGVVPAKSAREGIDKTIVCCNSLLGCKQVGSRASASWTSALESIFLTKMLHRRFKVGYIGHV